MWLRARTNFCCMHPRNYNYSFISKNGYKHPLCQIDPMFLSRTDNTMKCMVHIFLQCSGSVAKKCIQLRAWRKGSGYGQIIGKSTLYWKLIHLYLPCFFFRVCFCAAPRLAAQHVLARLNRTSKDIRPWRIETWGHESHSNPHKDKPCVSAPLKNRQTTAALWNIMKCHGPGQSNAYWF